MTLSIFSQVILVSLSGNCPGVLNFSCKFIVLDVPWVSILCLGYCSTDIFFLFVLLYQYFWYFDMQKIYILNWSNLSVFPFMTYCFYDLFKKQFPILRSKRQSPIFSYKIFLKFCFNTFRLIIYLEFIFVQSIKQASNFILFFYMDTQLLLAFIEQAKFVPLICHVTPYLSSFHV